MCVLLFACPKATMNATQITATAIECSEQWGLYLSVAAGLLAVVSELLGASDCQHNGIVHACMNVLRARLQVPES